MRYDTEQRWGEARRAAMIRQERPAQAACRDLGTCGRSAAVRSAFMRAEEIDEERARSGWNPYYGEEEEQPVQAEWKPADQMGAPAQPAWKPADQMGASAQTEWEPADQTGASAQTEWGPAGQMGTSAQPAWEPAGQMGASVQTERKPAGQMGASAQPQRIAERTAEVMQPYFMQPDYAQILEEQKIAERDLRMLQSMYPAAAKALLPYIEEACDRMEFEGSTMYDEHPDPTTMYRLVEQVRGQAGETLAGMVEEYNLPDETRWEEDDLPGEAGQTDSNLPGEMRWMNGNLQGETRREESNLPGEMQWTGENRRLGTEDVFAMQHRGPGRRRPGQSWPDDLIRVLLLQEMYHRRCRHRGCRRGLG